jgi:hypothetical protein
MRHQPVPGSSRVHVSDSALSDSALSDSAFKEKEHMFDFQAYNSHFIANPGDFNSAEPYGAQVLPITAPEGGGWTLRCIGIHHLLPDENKGNHNIFVDVLDPTGHRLEDALLGWTWEGRKEDEPAPPIPMTKPDNEPGWNIALSINQTVSIWIESYTYPSDVVTNLHTRHPDEVYPDGGGTKGNTTGHHSFYVAFQLTKTTEAAPPEEEEDPEEDDPPTNDDLWDDLPDTWRERLQVAAYQLRQIIDLIEEPTA